jgi:hypothetical protein
VKVTASPAPGELHAVELLPKLDDLGFAQTQTGKPSATTNFQDVALAQYVKSSSPAMAARVEISVLPDVTTATQQFGVLSEALRNPPPDLFGPNSQQSDTTRSGPGDEGRAFVTAKPDGQGNYVWSDAYRFGRTFVVVYLIATNEKDALPVRKAIAEHIAAGTR